MIACPACKGIETDLLWDRVIWCRTCHKASLLRDQRYTLVCKREGSNLIPIGAEGYLKCPSCKKLYTVPVQSNKLVVEEEL